jgi:hypothetical protein
MNTNHNDVPMPHREVRHRESSILQRRFAAAKSGHEYE